MNTECDLRKNQQAPSSPEVLALRKPLFALVSDQLKSRAGVAHSHRKTAQELLNHIHIVTVRTNSPSHSVTLFVIE